MRLVNKRKVNEALIIFFEVHRYLLLSNMEYTFCLEAIKRDPTGALRCYKAILASYGG